ncbi:hypothetical protein [Sanguibacter sp. Z1732]|uniref:hypothetical protein n=1 Tax=Sanguibacter sp. Z1732 TaxID=3435412 RepID=UPI003D9C9733
MVVLGAVGCVPMVLGALGCVPVVLGALSARARLRLTPPRTFAPVRAAVPVPRWWVR